MAHSFTTRQPFFTFNAFLKALLVVSVLSACQEKIPFNTHDPINVGVLHSLSGTMNTSAQSLVNATLLAIDEVNAQGGILGRPVNAIVADGQSNPLLFAEHSERLITAQNVVAVFGGGSSASRKYMKPIFELHQNLLFYPWQSEGLEASDHIIYLGSTPNQQLSPAVKWFLNHMGSRVYLAASNDLFSHATHTQIKKQVQALGGSIVGESYIPKGHKNFRNMMDDISYTQPDVILNTITGDSNAAFFYELNQVNHKQPNDKFISALSFNLNEADLATINPALVTQHYAASSYFQSISTPKNATFITKFKARFGQDSIMTAPMVAAYSAVHLWANTARKSKSIKPTVIQNRLHGEQFLSPEGSLLISHNNHAWKPLFIGKITDQSTIEIVYTNKKSIRPLPYPSYKSKQFWQAYLNTLYQSWGNTWIAPLTAPLPKTPEHRVSAQEYLP